MMTKNIYVMRSDDKPREQQRETRMLEKQNNMPGTGYLVMNSENMTIYADICGPYHKVTKADTGCSKNIWKNRH